MKGQVSFDLIIAILVLLIVVQLFQGVIADAAASQESISIRTQQKTIGRELARVIDSAVMLSSSAPEFPFEIEYTIPQVYSAGSAVPLGCDIQVTSEKISLESETLTEPRVQITTEIDWVAPGLANWSRIAECGETIKINQDWVG